MTEVMGSDPNLDMVPESPGVYIWTIDFTRLLRLPPAQASERFEALITQPLGVDEGRIPPFYSVAVGQAPPSMTAGKLAHLELLIQQNQSVASWVLLNATWMQRPLYVGQAINLRIASTTAHAAGFTFQAILS